MNLTQARKLYDGEALVSQEMRMTSVMIREVLEKSMPNELQTKGNFDRVSREGTKPSAETEGFARKKSDLVTQNSDNESLDTRIISESPNLYKQNGVPMSKIPYFFETPVPKYFRENGWFDNENTWKYVTWAFSKCQTQSHKTVIEGKEITLAPYEFISGRLSSPKECFLTENTFRNQQKVLLKAGFLKKTPNSKTNHYTCYIWVTERFNKNDNQQNNQPRTNHAPTINHKSEDKKRRYTESHPSIPSSEKKGRDEKIDDLFSKEENKNKIHIYSGKYHNDNVLHVHLSQQELDECLKVRGTMDQIKNVIEVVANWKQRKYEIKDWFKTIMTWNYRNTVADRSLENEKLGKEIHELYSECKGWSARVYRDPLKDDRGILFESSASVGNPIPVFVSFRDGEFKEKCSETIKNKNMKNKGEK